MCNVETWNTMTTRHKRERREMVERLAAQRITQTQAARTLGTTLTQLNNYIHRTGIYWPAVMRGRKNEGKMT